MKKYKLDKTFGKTGSILGYIIVLAGIYVSYYSWIGFTTIFVGAFLALSYNSSQIDFEKRKFKYSSNLFGFISIGSWLDIKDGMNLKIRETGKPSLSAHTKPTLSEFKIFLINDKGTEIMELCKTSTLFEAEKCFADIKEKLEI